MRHVGEVGTGQLHVAGIRPTFVRTGIRILGTALGHPEYVRVQLDVHNSEASHVVGENPRSAGCPFRMGLVVSLCGRSGQLIAQSGAPFRVLGQLGRLVRHDSHTIS